MSDPRSEYFNEDQIAEMDAGFPTDKLRAAAPASPSQTATTPDPLRALLDDPRVVEAQAKFFASATLPLNFSRNQFDAALAHLAGVTARVVLEEERRASPAVDATAPTDETEALLREADGGAHVAGTLVRRLATALRALSARCARAEQELTRYREQWYSGAFASAQQAVTPTEPLPDEELRYTAANAKAFVEGRDWPVVTQRESARTILRLIGEIRRLEDAKTHEVGHWFKLYESARARLASFLSALEGLPRFELGDDGGCSDPECCGGASPMMHEAKDGDYVKLAAVRRLFDTPQEPQNG